MPYLPTDGYMSDIISTTRTVQLFSISRDTLVSNNIWFRPDQNSIAAIYNFLKTQTTITFPSTAKIEGWWWLPGEDSLVVQVNDSSFATLAQNDIMVNNVL
jgi:hypothetical protein